MIDLQGMRNIALNEGSGESVSIFITGHRIVVFREESNVMALSTDGNGPLDAVRSRPEFHPERIFHGNNFLVKHVLILAF